MGNEFYGYFIFCLLPLTFPWNSHLLLLNDKNWKTMFIQKVWGLQHFKINIDIVETLANARGILNDKLFKTVIFSQKTIHFPISWKTLNSYQRIESEWYSIKIICNRHIDDKPFISFLLFERTMFYNLVLIFGGTPFMHNFVLSCQI